MSELNLMNKRAELRAERSARRILRVMPGVWDQRTSGL